MLSTNKKKLEHFVNCVFENSYKIDRSVVAKVLFYFVLFIIRLCVFYKFVVLTLYNDRGVFTTYFRGRGR